jgi:hypothetical protein
MDNTVREFIRRVHKICPLAKCWPAVPTWQELKEEEVQDILKKEGELAFEQVGRRIGAETIRGPLVKRRYKAGGGEVIELTGEAEERLKIRAGLGCGFRHVDEKTGEEFLIRLLQLGGGYVEVGLSWYGMAAPWEENWEGGVRSPSERIRAFEELDQEVRNRVNHLIQRAPMLKDARKIMEAVLSQVGRQSTNPIHIAAVGFRVLLSLENDPHWKARVEAGLNALRACTFRVSSFGTEQIKGYGAFLGEWWYRGAGPGDHGDGDYFLHVQPGFLGCLSVFKSGTKKLVCGREVTTYDFGKELTSADKSTMGWDKKRNRGPALTFSRFDAGGVFYNAAEGFSPEQQNLVDFIEREPTLKKDAVTRILGNPRVRKA